MYETLVRVHDVSWDMPGTMSKRILSRQMTTKWTAHAPVLETCKCQHLVTRIEKYTELSRAAERPEGSHLEVSQYGPATDRDLECISRLQSGLGIGARQGRAALGHSNENREHRRGSEFGGG